MNECLREPAARSKNVDGASNTRPVAVPSEAARDVAPLLGVLTEQISATPLQCCMP